MAGQAVSIALNEGNINEHGLRSYLQWYEKYFYEPYGKAIPSVLEFQDYLNADELDYLAELPGKTLLQTMDFLEMVKAIGKTYAELMSRISEERPEILEKLLKLREQRATDLEKRVRCGFPNVFPT